MSVSLNLTDKNADVKPHNKNGLQNLGNFINPITSSNHGDEKTFKGINNTTFSIQSDLLDTKDSRKHQVQHLYELQQQQIQELQQHNFSKLATNKILMDIIKPIVTEGYKSPGEEFNTNTDHSTIQIIANPNNNQHYEQMNDESRKVIMPLALKTTLIERERPISTPSPLPNPKSNIEDLKKHILMLQNYSEVDKNFQSKFVVFKKSTTEAPTTTTTITITETSTSIQKATTMPFPMTMGPMYRTKPSINMPLQNAQILRDVSYPYSRVERVTVIPQVFLQNDQQQPDTEGDDNDRRRAKQEERRNNRKNEKKMKKERKRNNKNMISPVTTAAVPLRSMRREQRRRNNFDMSQQKPFNGSQVLISTSTTATPNAPYIINLNDKILSNSTNDNARKLSRTIRSKANRRKNQNKMQRDILASMETFSNKNVTNEKIDLNPKHCYEVSGMSKGQQKLCDQFTSIMPAISRGARAAIQVRL